MVTGEPQQDTTDPTLVQQDTTEGAQAPLPPIIPPPSELHKDIFRIGKDKSRCVELRGQRGVMDSIRVKAADLGELWDLKKSPLPVFSSSMHACSHCMLHVNLSAIVIH